MGNTTNKNADIGFNRRDLFKTGLVLAGIKGERLPRVVLDFSNVEAPAKN